jgi:predicted transposase YdaD
VTVWSNYDSNHSCHAHRDSTLILLIYRHGLRVTEQAKQLIQRVQLESTTALPKNEIIDIITTIAVYKFSSLSREEVEGTEYRLQGENYVITESSYFPNVREIVQQCLQIANEQTTSEAIRWFRNFLRRSY